MRPPPAHALLLCALLAACADTPSYERTRAPALAVPTPIAGSAKVPIPDPELSTVDEETATGGIELDPQAPPPDAGQSKDADGADAMQPDAESDAGGDAQANPGCRRGAHQLVTFALDARVGDTLRIDDMFIYVQSAFGANTASREILALPRAALFEPSTALQPLTILQDDFSIRALAEGGDGYLFFIAMPHGDASNQGLFRVRKRERAGIESVPIHALASDDFWPGQLAADQDYFYLASIGPSSHSLRIVRYGRTDQQREELWLDTAPSHDGDALGALSLRDGDIALDADHVYFSVRVNRERAPHDYRIYRVGKQGRQQSAQLITTITRSYGGLAADGAHLFFSHEGSLEQLDLASGAREQLVAQDGIRDLSYRDEVLSWTATDGRTENLTFFCL